MQHTTQSGIILIISLVMLASISLIGVFAMDNSRLEWLMANNEHFQADALMRAEAAVHQGELFVGDIADPAGYSGPGFHNGPLPIDPAVTANWQNGSLGDVGTYSSEPEGDYLAEYLGCEALPIAGPMPLDCEDPTAARLHLYRIWGFASDGKGAERIAVSTYWVIRNPGPAMTFGILEVPAGTTPMVLRSDYAEIS